MLRQTPKERDNDPIRFGIHRNPNTPTYLLSHRFMHERLLTVPHLQRKNQKDELLNPPLGFEKRALTRMRESQPRTIPQDLQRKAHYLGHVRYLAGIVCT
jgi:hypothetical protein